MEIIDGQTFKEFFTTVFQNEMTKIDKRISGYSGSEDRFQKDKRRLDYFAKFLSEYQYFDKTVKKKPFLKTFEDTVISLSKWERQYTKELGENSVQTLDYRERRNTFRNTMRSFVNRIIETYFLFNQDDNIVGVYHKYKKHKSQEYNLDSLDVLKTFTRDYSLLLIDLITYESQNMVSNVLRELLAKTKLLDRLQALCAKEWYALSKEVQEKDLQSSPVLKIYLESRSRTKKSRHPSPRTPQEFFIQVIDQTKLITNSEDLTKTVKAEELLSFTDVIKGLLAELREGDEIAVNDALTIIEESRQLEYLSQEELEDYFKQILIDLPDFEYIRLKKSFRRKASSPNELLTNIDTLFIHSIPSSLKNIEKKLLEIHQNQSELLDQTRQTQEFLEAQFEVVMENQTQIEEYLFQKLGSEYEKIKHLWLKYKEKQLSGKEFLQEATKTLGPRFGRIFAGILFLLK